MKVIFFEKTGNIDYRISGQFLPINSLPLFTLDTERNTVFEISDSERITDVLIDFKEQIQKGKKVFDEWIGELDKLGIQYYLTSLNNSIPNEGWLRFTSDNRFYITPPYWHGNYDSVIKGIEDRIKELS